MLTNIIIVKHYIIVSMCNIICLNDKEKTVNFVLDTNHGLFAGIAPHVRVLLVVRRDLPGDVCTVGVSGEGNQGEDAGGNHPDVHP